MAPITTRGEHIIDVYTHVYIHTYVRTYIHTYIQGQGWGFPGASRNPQPVMYYKRRYGIEMGVWGGVGGVITSCGLRWIETCWNLEDVALLKMLLRCKYRCCLQKGGLGGGEGVITSCGARWIESCWNLQDVASLKLLLLRLQREKTNGALSLQTTASKSLCGRENEKGVMFISSMVLQWIMTFSSCQQNDQKCTKLQFQWFRCCTHVWPSMEDVNLSFFCTDKHQVYPRRHCNFSWSNNWEKSIKHGKAHCKINIFHIHTNKMQLVSGEPPAFTLHTYIHPYAYVRTYVRTCIHPSIHPSVHPSIPTYVRAYVRALTYIHTYMHACMHTYIHTLIHVLIHSYIHINMHACIHAPMHACIHTYMHPSMHAYIHTCMHIHTYIHACMHACIHTYRCVCVHRHAHMHMYICICVVYLICPPAGAWL